MNENVIKIYQEKESKQKKFLEEKKIGKNDFYSHSLFISEYFIFYNIQTDTLTILIFDFQTNKLHLFKSSIEKLTNERSINKSVDLREFGYNFEKVQCQHLRANIDEFQCQLFSSE